MQMAGPCACLRVRHWRRARHVSATPKRLRRGRQCDLAARLAGDPTATGASQDPRARCRL
eukprot:scaffold3731_cov381-Prasinococcus_capsulatus_cf.AAC.11